MAGNAAGQEPLGLYIHVPFCLSKCPYCDFYSLARPDDGLMDAYTAAVCRSLDEWARRLNASADTLYFGGGTPSLLGGERLAAIIERAAAGFGLCGAEITLEANPADDLAETFRCFAAAGGNRVSMGMQSADSGELRGLGRRHTPDETARAVEAAHAAGIGNLSLDLMLALPGQTGERVTRSAESCRELGARHVSAYLLKIEEGTPFYRRRDTLALPDEDRAAELYLHACGALERLGYRQYEISNFSEPGFESRHNRKYWLSAPYLGIGPSAHSCLGGRRFYYPRDLEGFLKGGEPLDEDSDDRVIPDGSPEEYLMLRLRLAEGVREEEYGARFGAAIPDRWRQRALALPRELILCDDEGIRLTRKGFLLSNAILGRLL